MSRTDNTRPYWVLLEQEPQDVIECHNHEHGVCDLTDYIPQQNFSFCHWAHHCRLRFRRKNEYWIFNGRPNVKHYRPQHVSAERAAWRNKAADLRKMSLEDIYDDEFGNYQHRHSALWEAW